jgi:hypothetical protein
LKKIFNLPQIYTYSERENPCLNMKAWKACCNSFKWSTIHKSIGVTILVGPLSSHPLHKVSKQQIIFLSLVTKSKMLIIRARFPCMWMSLRIGPKC